MSCRVVSIHPSSGLPPGLPVRVVSLCPSPFGDESGIEPILGAHLWFCLGFWYRHQFFFVVSLAQIVSLGIRFHSWASVLIVRHLFSSSGICFHHQASVFALWHWFSLSGISLVTWHPFSSSRIHFRCRVSVSIVQHPFSLFGISFRHLASIFTVVFSSDVLGLAWPESPGLGLAYEGPGLFKPQARPRWWA